MPPRVIEEFVLLFIGIVVVATRLYVRIKTVGWQRLQPDDWLMVAAAVGTCCSLIPFRVILAEEVLIQLRSVTLLKRASHLRSGPIGKASPTVA